VSHGTVRCGTVIEVDVAHKKRLGFRRRSDLMELF
jgi:hypothetical protein